MQIPEQNNSSSVHEWEHNQNRNDSILAFLTEVNQDSDKNSDTQEKYNTHNILVNNNNNLNEDLHNDLDNQTLEITLKL